MADNENNEKTQADHYAAVLADLKMKRAQLDFAISALEQQAGIAPSVTSTSGAPLMDATGAGGRSAGDQTIRPDEFFGLGVLDATEKFLNIMKKPQPLQNISAALERGGLIHQSKNFAATVFTTLRRAEDRADRVVRVPKQGWGLMSWYPNRPRPVKEEKPKAKKAKKPAKSSPKPKLAVAGADPAKAATPASEAAQQVAS